MKYMLDTNICIYIIKKKTEEIIKKFKKTRLGETCISSISLSELKYGVYKSKYPEKNKVALIEFLIPIEILNYDDFAAEKYGKIGSDLEKKGQIISPMDMLIASHAASKNLILVTNNEKEFKRIVDLKIENWTK